ncbi:MAG: VWA domain-containing protein [Flavobacteriales bacterium]|nr:VWA domain-containing protein [Flavobacteriales bacterium]
MRYKAINIFLFLFLIARINDCYTQNNTPQKTRILFVLDCSQSMYGLWGNEQKMIVAKRLLTKAVDSLRNVENLELALRLYGHQSPLAAGQRDCKDTKLEVAFAAKNHNQIIEKIKSIIPKGTTPIAYSLEKSANDFPPCTNCRNIIILITDGIEECDGDPCAISLALQRNGVVLKPFVIGMSLSVEVADAFKCVGNFYNTETSVAFQNALNVVISQAMNNTTVQVNLLDIHGNPSETDVNMTFYDSFSKQIRYNFIHTINHKGNPDTIPIDPLGTYKLVVHTIPQVTKDNITIVPGKHNIIGLDAPQGSIHLKINGINEYTNLKAIIRKKGDMQTLAVHDIDFTQKYIVGEYDLEILTLPRTYVKAVPVSQSHTTKVEIPAPGMVTVYSNNKGYGSIYVEENNELKWVCNLNEYSTRETIVLQPGQYRAVYRSANSKQVIYSKEIPFVIKAGSSSQVKF